ncbi:MAG: aminotransferase class I/II-fold pyridoxal phosphate-dependent enzyme [Enterobacterales bacterium]|nr:aminotransferase class I/II-fold pyridoxal phosphate-dependent enzyme [Enterobacterales bacterium]
MGQKLTEKMLMMGGYSYLGLNHRQSIKNAALESIESFGTGMSGSRFLAGSTNLHSELEREVAQLHGKQDAMLLTSGYLTNISTITALVKKAILLFAISKIMPVLWMVRVIQMANYYDIGIMILAIWN